MAKKNNIISNSNIDCLLTGAGIRRGKAHVRSYISGMNVCHHLIPDDVVSWTTTHDLSREGKKFHHRYVLKIPLNGENLSCVDGRFFWLHPGQALLIFPWQLHANSRLPAAHQAAEMLLISFTLAAPEAREFIGHLKNRIITLKPDWDDKLLRIIRAYQANTAEAEADGVFALACLLPEIAALHPEEETAKQTSQLTMICDHIRQNCHRRLNIKTIADHFDISGTTLRRLFKQAFNGAVTPADFLETVRIQHAAMLLLHTGLPLSEIAVKCGFRDQFGFSRSFRRIAGLPPGEYRKNAGSAALEKVMKIRHIR